MVNMSSTQDFSCVFCSETFEDKESLQEHFRKHGDPKFNSNTKNKARFQNEVSGGNEKSEEGELVGCDVCDEMFKSISKAITHKHKVHPDHDAKYFCPWCGKLFTMKHLYNKHMEANHTDMSMTEQSNYHCDSCSVDFFVPSAMVYHNRFFHRQDTELPAIGHSKKVKTFNQELIQIYYCPFCGEEYNNKVNLHKHMLDDHSDENQRPEEVLRCPVCDAVFYHLDAYELHLCFHTSDDTFSDDREIAVTEFSLESVPPVMEKVEEEVKFPDTEGIDKFLQLVMDESRENGNNDGLDKPKSKKHKKHKKSKKAAITLDEFLNMNKDVFGDGLDVQGIEEVPTQQVLKKCKRKSDTAKPIPASAIAKLKKQGITIKSNSGSNPALFKTNRNLIINKTKIAPNIPMKTSDKHTAITSSNDLLSKLLNQGNSQIKVVKKSTTEILNKNTSDHDTNLQEPTTSNIKKPISDKNLSLQEDDADAGIKNGKKTDEMEQDSSDLKPNDSLNEKYLINNSNITNDTDMDDSTSASHENINTTVNHDEEEPVNYDEDNENDTNIVNSGPIISESLDSLQKSDQVTDVNDQEHSFETNEEDIVSNVRDSGVVRNITKNKLSNNFPEENYNNFKRPSIRPLDALKHLSGVITIKPGHSIEEKNDILEKKQSNMEKDTEELAQNTTLKVSTNIEKNVQNVCLKKPHNSPYKKIDTPTKSIDSLKNLHRQITITPCVSSTTKSNDESEDDEPEDYNSEDKINTPSTNINNEKDKANFKTPMSISKQLNTTSILKRLTNVTAKPIARVPNISQENDNQPVDSKMSVIQKKCVNKQIDEDIEIFNIDDSDSDQEFPTEEYGQKQVLNSTTTNKAKVIPSDNVFKNLNKNITIKPANTFNKKTFNIKKEVPSEKPKLISDQDVQSPSSNENKIYTQNKHINKNLNQTLKKLGNNISIKSQYSTPDFHKMLYDEHMDDDFDTHDEDSDSETNNHLKITEVQEDENLPSDNEMEHNENVIVQSPHASNSENEEEISNSHSSDEKNNDIETQIKTNTLSKETTATQCLDNFKRNNRELTIRSINDKNVNLPQTGSPNRKQEEAMRVTNKFSKDMSAKPFRAAEKQDENDMSSKTVTEAAATSSSSQKVTNQVNTVKTVKTFQSETIIEEITTTVTKTIRTVNQSSKQVAKNPSTPTYRPRVIVSNQQSKPLQGMTVRNAQTVGTKIRNATPSPRPTTIVPTKTAGQLVPVRPQNPIAPRIQGIYKPNVAGTSNIRKTSPQPNIQKPVVGKPLKISPLAMTQTIKRAPEKMVPHINFKRPKDLTVPSMDTLEDDIDDSVVNYSSASSSRSDYSTTATKMVKGKSVITATQARSEQHSEQHISKLSNMTGLKIVRTSAKQASQVETRNEMSAAKRTTMDAIEKLQKQGLLVKKPRIEAPEEDEHYDSDNDGCEEEYEENVMNG